MELNQNTLDALANLRNNIVSWYPFQENCTILDVTTGTSAITNELGRYAKNVVAVGSQKELEKIQSQKFDYITLIGTIEYSEEVFRMTPEELIKHLKKFLKEGGKFLIATDNKLGINILCTETKQSKGKLLGKKTIEDILENQGLINRKFYYPLPNYIVPNVIFTDKHLPDSETINRCLTFYDSNTICALDEVKRFKKVLEEDKQEFCKLANSFFIECATERLEENNIEFVSFSNIRKPEYRIKTIIQGENVYKYNLDESSKKHLQNVKNNIDILNKSNLKTVDSYDETRIISKYQKNALTLDRVIMRKLKAGEKAHAIDLIIKFEDELLEKLEKTDNQNNVFDKYMIDYQKEDIENLNFVKNGLWDLILKNCFYIDDQFYFYDQEWYDENVPLEFIMFRAILYFPELTKFIQSEEIYEKLGITQKQIGLFKKLDDALQSQTRDEVIWNVHANISQQSNIPEKIKRLEADKEKILHDCKELLLQKDARIKDLEKGMEEAIDTIKTKDNEISSMVNSMSWKITKPLRKIKGTDKKGE